MLMHSKKRTRSKRSLHGSPVLKVTPLDLNAEDVSDEEFEQPLKRVALQVSFFFLINNLKIQLLIEFIC